VYPSGMQNRTLDSYLADMHGIPIPLMHYAFGTQQRGRVTVANVHDLQFDIGETRRPAHLTLGR
jgi:hypothetical protein